MMTRLYANVLSGAVCAALVGAFVAVAAGQSAEVVPDPPEPALEQSAPEAQAPPEQAEEPAEPPGERPQPDATQPAAPSYNLLTANRLTGDWFGARTKLQDAGISFDPLFAVGYQQNFRGGANTHNAHDVAGMAFWNLEFDFGKMGLAPGATFFARGSQSWHSGIRPDVGSLTHPGVVVSTLGDSEIEIQKWWWRQRLFDDRLEFRLGKLYTGDTMDTVEYAGNPIGKFMNEALFRNMTVPETIGLGTFVKVWPTDWLYLAGQVVDAESDLDINRRGTGGFDSTFHGPARFLTYGELGFLPAELPVAEGWWPGHYRFGVWHDFTPKTVFINDLGGRRAEQLDNSDVGFYMNLDQMVWKENQYPTDKQGLGLFVRYGLTHKHVNLINHYWAVGAEYTGLLPSRDTDTLGFGVTQSILSGQHRRTIDEFDDRETVYELYYAFKLTPWCTISPDIQIITNPGGQKGARDALVGGLRITMSF